MGDDVAKARLDSQLELYFNEPTPAKKTQISEQINGSNGVVAMDTSRPSIL